MKNNKSQLRRKKLLKKMSNLRIGILYSDSSLEAYISKAAATNIEINLNKLGVKCFIVPEDSLLSFIEEKKINFLYNVHYGEAGENGVLAGLLETLDIPYTYSDCTASVISLNKFYSKIIAKSIGIPTLEHVFIDGSKLEKDILNAVGKLGFPIIAKPIYGGSSVGIRSFKNISEFKRHMPKLIPKYGNYIIEPMITGDEFSIGLLETFDSPVRVLPCLKLKYRNSYISEELKYKGGLSYMLVNKTKRNIAIWAKKLYKILGCFPVARLDFRCDCLGRPYFLEINHFPGMTNHSWLPMMAAGVKIEFEDLLLEIIASSLQRWDNQKNNVKVRINLKNLADTHQFKKTSQITFLVPNDNQGLNSCRPSANNVSKLLSHTSSIVKYCEFKEIRNTIFFECLYGKHWDGPQVRALLDYLKIKRIGPSIETCALAHDKLKQRLFIKGFDSNILQPKFFSADEIVKDENAKFPIVAKPRRDSQSADIVILRNKEELERYVSENLENISEQIFEEFMNGNEYYIGIIRGFNNTPTLLPIIEIKHKAPTSFLTNKQKRKLDSKNVSVLTKVPEKLIEICSQSLKIHALFNSPPISRVEWRQNGSEIKLLEYDYTPALTERSFITKMLANDSKGLLNNLIKLKEKNIF